MILIFVSLLFACSSDDNTTSMNFTSNIKVDGVPFTPDKAKVVNVVPNSSGEESKVFTLEKGTFGEDNYEAIVVIIKYSSSSSVAPNGVYDFGIGEVGETLFAQGSYKKGDGSNFYSLAGYTIQVTSLEINKYKLEFQNVQAVGINSNIIKIISGTFEGDMLVNNN